MCKKEEQAYMTVEASLVLPTIIGGIIFILYLGIFLYNYCTINQTAYIAALRGSQIKNVSTDEIDNYVKKQIDELLFQQILARENIKKEMVTISFYFYLSFFHIFLNTRLTQFISFKKNKE